jgi:starch-binding outer membrane protein, SusD/RagB family
MKTKYITLSLVFLLVTSCKESFLDLAPISNSNAVTFYKTKADFDLASSAAYSTLYTFFAPQGGVSYFSEQMSDNATIYNVVGTIADKRAFKDFTLNSSNSMVYTFWQNSYRALFTTNVVLDKIETVTDLDPTYKAQTVAEMKFLRSLYYYYMVQMWGDIPFVKSPVTAEESYKILRSPKAEILDFIIQDLNTAVAALPAAAAVKIAGHASKGAAQALLAKVYLLKGNKAEAAKVLAEIINSGSYGLLPKYADVFAVANKNTKESIFEIQYKGGAAGVPLSDFYNEYSPFENFSITLYGGGMNQVTDDLYNEYEDNDPRRDLTVAPGYTNKAGTFVAIKYPVKWTDKAAPIINSREAASNNFSVFRYADILLMMAEATADAKYLNEVRKRAGLAEYGSASYPTKYNNLDLAIEHERRVELAIEFHRGLDLRRTGRAVAVLGAKGKSLTADKLMLPIPEIVRQQNAAITQNAGY